MSSTQTKLTLRGTKTVFPVTGFFVEEIQIKYCQMPGLVFSNWKDRFNLSILSSNIELLRGSNKLLEVLIDDVRSTPGTNFSPILELLGSEVEDAYAEKNGELRIGFSNKLDLFIRPEVYEGWGFKGINWQVIGADGKLIIFVS